VGVGLEGIDHASQWAENTQPINLQIIEPANPATVGDKGLAVGRRIHRPVAEIFRLTVLVEQQAADSLNPGYLGLGVNGSGLKTSGELQVALVAAG